SVVWVVMLVHPHELLQNQPHGNRGVKVQNNSCCGIRRLLRVAASSNLSFKQDATKALRPLTLRRIPNYIEAKHNG
ncbi:hypothetical protein, partial [Halothiobacillus sp.]|uniref:hypothetical protein n=1 Tax=Halothiobacillus sp. TaxID=1891311 RepID=UPI002AD54A0D